MIERILKRDINGTAYTIVPLASKAGGLDVYRKLHKHLAPTLGAFFRLIGEGGSLDEVGPEVAQTLVLHLGEAMGDPEFCAIVDRMLGACAVNSGPIPLEWWDAHLEDHDELVGYCVWVNFLSPFAGPLLRRLGVDPAQLVGAALSRLRTSTPTTPGS